MSDLLIGYIGLAAMILLLIVGLPIPLALASVGLLGILVIKGPTALAHTASTTLFDASASWLLATVPMFLLIGNVAAASGIITKLFVSVQLWLGRIRGSLAIATVFTCAAFAAVCGSTFAVAIAMTRIAYPEMKKYGFDRKFAAAVICSGGPLAQLIPPSLGFIILAVYLGLSVAKLFIAGIIPGILTALAFSALILIRCTVNPNLAPLQVAKATWSERFRSIPGTWPLPALIVVILVGMFLGVFTPTEAGAVGAIVTLIIAVVMNPGKSFSFRRLFAEPSTDTALATANILLLLVGAMIYSRFITIAGVPSSISAFAQGLSATMPLPVVTLALLLVYLVLGMLMDPLSMLLVTLPIVLPIMDAYHANLIWFCVLAVKFQELCVITPPVGLLVFVVSGILREDVSTAELFRSVWWFVITDLIVVIILIMFPILSLWLPGLIS